MRQNLKVGVGGPEETLQNKLPQVDDVRVSRPNVVREGRRCGTVVDSDGIQRFQRVHTFLKLSAKVFEEDEEELREVNGGDEGLEGERRSVSLSLDSRGA